MRQHSSILKSPKPKTETEMSKSRNALLTAAAILAATAMIGVSPANAADGYVAVGIAATPEYEGADEQQLIPFVAGQINFGRRYVAFDGLTLRANLSPIDGFEFGPVAGYRFGRDADVDNASVALLPQIDDAFEAGAFAALTSKGIINADDEARFELRGLHDVSGAHESWVLTPAVSYAASMGPKIRWKTEISADFVGDDYAATYFTIAPSDALASGLGAFDAEGGFKDIGLSFQWNYDLGRNWGLTGYSSYKRLIGDAADSPIVRDAGDENQFTVGFGVSRSF